MIIICTSNIYVWAASEAMVTPLVNPINDCSQAN
jgi:hypothetical protein